MFLMIVQHLALARSRPGSRGLGGWRQSFLDFRQVLNAVTRKRDVFSGWRHARNDVVAFALKSFSICRESLFLALKIAIADLQ